MRNNRLSKWMAFLFVAGMAMSAQASWPTATIVRDGAVDANNLGTGAVITNETWTANNVYVLNGLIFVTDGATLTIEPGTLIRMRERADGVGGAPGTLIVARGSKIRALGTRDQPIVMTTMLDDHFVGPNPVAGSAPWSTPNNGITERGGGLVVQGRGYIADGATTPVATGNKQTEGMVAYGDHSRYGGGNDDDDSGVIRHVSIRYGGFVLGEASEINGLTLSAVGRGTTVEHVEAFQNKDDGIWFAGGTVNTKYMVSWKAGDEGFDWDEGYRGKGQFWLGVQGFLSGEGDLSDKAAELDGATTSDASQPSAIGTVYNMTVVGMGKDSLRLINSAMHFRDGSGGRFYNSMFLDFGGAIALIEGNPAAAGVHSSGRMTVFDYAHVRPGPGEPPTGNAGAGLAGYIGYTHETGGSKMLELRNNVFWKFGYPNAWGNVAGAGAPNNAARYGTSPAEGLLHHHGLDTGFDLFAAGLNNVYLDEAVHPTPVVELIRSTTDAVPGVPVHFPIEALNPNLPAGSPYLTGGRTPPNDAFFTPVTFHGAFNDTANWASWTLAARKGLLEIEPGTLRTDYDQPFIQAEHLTYTVQYMADVASLTYRVQHTVTLAPPTWVTIDTRTGVTGMQTFTDTRPLAGSGFYRVTKE